MNNHRTRTESGFTLPEVLLASTIGAIIIGVLGVSLTLMFKTDSSTIRRLSLSNDRQLAATYFQMDVQSATGVVAGMSNAECGARTSLVRLGWVDSSGTGYVAAYCIASSATGDDIVRVYKAGATSAENTVSRNVQPGSASVAQDTSTGIVTLKAKDIDSVEWKLQGTPHLALANPTAPTTTVLAPTTTTAAPLPTTTTTAVPVCSLTQKIGTNATSYTVKKNGNGAGELNSDIVVTVKTTTVCSTLKLELTRGASTKSYNLVPTSAGNYGVTILKSDGPWPTGQSTLVVKTGTGVVLEPAASNTVKVTIQ